jgi:hypothetical protein
MPSHPTFLGRFVGRCQELIAKAAEAKPEDKTVVQVVKQIARLFGALGMATTAIKGCFPDSLVNFVSEVDTSPDVGSRAASDKSKVLHVKEDVLPKAGPSSSSRSSRSASTPTNASASSSKQGLKDLSAPENSKMEDDLILLAETLLDCSTLPRNT